MLASRNQESGQLVSLPFQMAYTLCAVVCPIRVRSLTLRDREARNFIIGIALLHSIARA